MRDRGKLKYKKQVAKVASSNIQNLHLASDMDDLKKYA